MDFTLSNEQINFRNKIAEFATQVIEPLAHIVDMTGKIPEEIMQKAVENKLFGIPFAKKYGGSGLGYIGFVIA